MQSLLVEADHQLEEPSVSTAKNVGRLSITTQESAADDGRMNSLPLEATMTAHLLDEVIFAV